MAPSVLQNGGFILGLIGTAALVAATTTNKWSVDGRQGDLARSLYSYRGLWQECQTAASGFTECCPLHLTQGFSGKTKGSWNVGLQFEYLHCVQNWSLSLSYLN